MMLLLSSIFLPWPGRDEGDYLLQPPTDGRQNEQNFLRSQGNAGKFQKMINVTMLINFLLPNTKLLLLLVLL